MASQKTEALIQILLLADEAGIEVNVGLLPGPTSVATTTLKQSRRSKWDHFREFLSKEDATKEEPPTVIIAKYKKRYGANISRRDYAEPTPAVVYRIRSDRRKTANQHV